MNIYEKEHLNSLRALLPECTVLLRKSGAFPLEKPCSLVLCGNGARHTVKGGTGSGEVNSRFFVSAEEGLKEAGFNIVSGAWLDAYDKVRAKAQKKFADGAFKKMLRDPIGAVSEIMGAIVPEPEYSISLPVEGEAAVYVLSRISGEGTDRSFTKGDFLLTDSERRDILALAGNFSRFLLVLNTGGPVDLSGLESVGDILVLSQLGVETGAALADILLGKTYPSGKLTTTWASTEEYPRIGDFGGTEETEYREGVYVGYRYFDSAGIAPAFPFGFGLGYTEFETTCVSVSADGEHVCVQTETANVGSRCGKEIVQLYVSPPAGKIDKPYQALAAFAKTPELRPGERAGLTLKFDMSQLAVYDGKHARYVLEAGDYVLRLGSDSRRTEAVSVIRLDGQAVTAKVRNILGKPGFEDWNPGREFETEKRLPELVIRAENLPCRACDYYRPFAVSPEAARLDTESLIRLNVGYFKPGNAFQSIIGEASTSVAGAAGESFNGIVMADGPAGLRLSRQYVKSENGVKSVGLTIPESLSSVIPAPVVKALKKFSGSRVGKDEKRLEQYATAIPVGTAIAQSWNVALAEKCGDIVGEEMKLFGVDLWLAPALNIHRSVLCGRNYEYYSEDPLLSGKMAAGITRGVQKHPGCGVTIKHFAANNQEFKRYSNDSRLSERALREIYLRGFEIAVREGAPLALMTSYNLLNGIHTSEHLGLMRDILRYEWGYDGAVMTDWLISQEIMTKGSKHPAPQAWRIARAGGDVVMPGSAADTRNIRKAVKAGELSRRQLEINATRMLKLKPLKR